MRLPRITALTLTLMVVVVVGLSPAASAAGRSCVTAKLDAPLILPDGSEHPAGSLSLCKTRHESPVSTLYEAFVDKISVGLLQGHRVDTEASGEGPPYLMFLRDSAGRLRLYGFADPKRDGIEAFIMRPVGRS